MTSSFSINDVTDILEMNRHPGKLISGGRDDRACAVINQPLAYVVYCLLIVKHCTHMASFTAR